MYIKFFTNKEGRMSIHKFHTLCVQGKYLANRVKSLAESEGYAYMDDFFIDLQTNIDAAFPEQYLLRTGK